jgi:hypothetical protein
MIKKTILIMFLSLGMYGTIHAEEPVYFADANLKAVVELHLGKTNPTPTDMLALTDQLYANHNSIASLIGIEYATNLQKLFLHNNQITDISPLSGLTNLRGCICMLIKIRK